MKYVPIETFLELARLVEGLAISCGDSSVHNKISWMIHEINAAQGEPCDCCGGARMISEWCVTEKDGVHEVVCLCPKCGV